MAPTVKWNNDVKLIISDVDETICDTYVEATPGMVRELEKIFRDKKILFLITGHGIKGMQRRLTDKVSKHLRKRILIAECSGSVVHGFDENGDLNKEPFYDLYRNIPEQHKKKWREITQQLISEFRLNTYPTMPKPEFRILSKGDPFSIMLDDRGPQITFEVVNGAFLSKDRASSMGIDIPETNGVHDLRIPIMERAEELFLENDIPITPRLAGTFAIDFAIKNTSKKTAVEYIVGNKDVLSKLGLGKDILSNPKHIEVWGDKFSVIRGGTDRHISEALPKDVRSIDFRNEDPKEFLEGYNIVIWDGKKRLHNGVLEFLESR
jgi:hydroxymethylpyrimidine pyrophosphatase-like HAD family hydrolase